MLAILRVLQNPHDKVSLERVMRNILSGIGDVSISKILNALEEIPLLDPRVPDVLTTAKAKNGWQRLIIFIKSMQESYLYDEGEFSDPREIIERAVAHFNFMELTDDGTPASEERMRNLEVLASNADNYETLPEFLADAALMSSADEMSAQNSVTLMTMHAAKGLEFPVVFLVGMEEGLFPSSRSMEEDNLEEERRLAYVGITRAMQQLFLTYAGSRFSFGGRNYNMPSRFLSELGYNPYGSLGFSDEDGDGFLDGDDTDDNPFDDNPFDEDPFSDDLPVFE